MKLITPDSPNWCVLFQPAAHVLDYQQQVLPHLRAMIEVLNSKRALGVAAPQLGVPLRFFIYRAAPREVFRIVVNPTITHRFSSITVAEEGCLSFPGRFTQVERTEDVRVEYTNSEGNKVTRLLGGMESRVFQHECDHLDGVTIFPAEPVPANEQ